MSQKTTIVIYTKRITNRLRYVCHVIFDLHLKLPYILSETSHITEYESLIEYNSEPSGEYPTIPFEGLLAEEGSIRTQMPEVFGEEDQCTLYSIPSYPNAMLDFDIFSAVFYCLSMYQAYLPIPKDQHDRINYKHWHIRKTGLDKYPFVELWIQKLRASLNDIGFNLSVTPVKGAEISIDIDHFFAFSNRRFFRHLKGFMGDVARLNFNRFFQRARVIAGLEADPYQAFFDWLEQYQQPITFFILMKEGGKDSLNLNNHLKGSLIQSLQQFGNVGIHPSYKSSDNHECLVKEITLLEDILHQKVQQSRQHFLRWKMPDTFVALSNNGITNDYSLGYYDQPGFMCATSTPFPFYHLKEEKSLPLTLHPFCWMDSMNQYYRIMEMSEALQEVLLYMNRANIANSKAMFVFHNDNLILKKYTTIADALSDC
jgi:hypothetical protein